MYQGDLFINTKFISACRLTTTKTEMEENTAALKDGSEKFVG